MSNMFAPEDGAQQPSILSEPNMFTGQASSAYLETPEERVPHNFFTKALDLLSRPNYASAKFSDSILNEGMGLFGALKSATQEFFQPIERLSYRDVLAQAYPDFALQHPVYNSIIGFIGDVALDPTTYLSIGSAGALKISSKAFTDAEKAAMLAAKSGPLGWISRIHPLQLSEQARNFTDAERLIALSPAGEKALMEAEQKALVAAQGGIWEQGLARLGLTQPANVEIRELAEKEVANLIAAGNTHLVDTGGIKIFGKTIPGLGKKQFDKVGELTGITRIKEAVKNTKGYETMAKLFDRNFRLPQEYLKLREDLESRLGRIHNEVFDEVSHVFGELDEGSRMKIGDVAGEINDAVTGQFRELGNKINPDLAARIEQEIIAKSGLNPTEIEAFSSLTRKMKEIGEADLNAGLIKQMIAGYSPRVYAMTEDGKRFIFQKRKSNILSNFFGPGEAREFDTIEQAKLFGHTPETDAAVLYANRVIASRKAHAKQQFNKAVELQFGEKLEKVKGKVGSRIASDIKFIGETSFANGINDGMDEATNFYDKATRMFKAFATYVKPAFGVKQAFSNEFQTYAVLGARGLKAWDPSITKDAAAMLLYDRGIFHADSEIGQKIAQTVFKTNFGRTYTLPQVMEIVKNNHIIRGTNISGESLRKSIVRELKSQQRYKAVAQAMGVDPNVHEGFVKLIAGAAKYTDYASHIEDFSRASMFMNALKIGHSESQAASLVNKALFDYQNGLSWFEKNVARRIVPFYSYQRFAVPLLMDTLVHNPGRVANVNKLAQGFFSAWNGLSKGETLNEAERAVLPDYLLEQSNFLQKFDPDTQAVFKTFNNFSFLDAFGMIESDKRGNIDWQRTLIKSVAAQVVPFIKIPFELALDKGFFSNRAISEMGKIGNVTPEGVIGNIAALVAGYKIGAPAAIGAKLAGNFSFAPEFVQSTIKAMLGWEDGVDPRTGKRNVYINPYLFYGFTSMFPALNQVVRLDRTDMTPTEKAQDLVLGIGTQKLNLKQQQRRVSATQKHDVSDAKYALRQAILMQRPDLVDERQQELEELLRAIADENRSIASGPIRGK